MTDENASISKAVAVVYSAHQRVEKKERNEKRIGHY